MYTTSPERRGYSIIMEPKLYHHIDSVTYWYPVNKRTKLAQWETGCAVWSVFDVRFGKNISMIEIHQIAQLKTPNCTLNQYGV